MAKKNISNVTVEECIELKTTLAKYILPRLMKYKEISTAYPADLENEEEWDVILDKMIWSFDYVVKDEFISDIEQRKEQISKYEEGMKLFAEYFSHLWD